MEDKDKEIIENYFDLTSNTLTELSRITPGCSLVTQENLIQPLVPNKDADFSFQEYFVQCAKLALESDAKYLLLGCEQIIEGEKYLAVVCHPNNPKEDTMTLCSKILSDPTGKRFTTDQKEWINQHGQEVDIEDYSDEIIWG